MLSGLPLTAGPGLAQPSERGDTATRRLVTAAYREEQEAPEKVARLGSTVDACLFASRVPYEYARRAGVLTVPATYIQLSGSALYAAMLRASREGLDIARSSIDVVSQADAEDAFSELGISAGGVRVREEVSGAAIIAAFHERLWHQEETAVAFTCLQSVARKLATAQVPVFQLLPTGSAILSALRTGTLLAGYRRLENAQLAVVIVEVPTLRDTVRRGAPRQAREELRLTVHRFLVQEAQRIHATVSALNEHGFLVVATRGSLSQAADGLGGPPFVERAEGAWVTDADGNRYVDYVGAWGPMILGHAFGPVVEAIERAARNSAGSPFSVTSPVTTVSVGAKACAAAMAASVAATCSPPKWTSLR